jgi:hypothetical protein
MCAGSTNQTLSTPTLRRHYLLEIVVIDFVDQTIHPVTGGEIEFAVDADQPLYASIYVRRFRVVGNRGFPIGDPKGDLIDTSAQTLTSLRYSVPTNETHLFHLLGFVAAASVKQAIRSVSASVFESVPSRLLLTDLGGPQTVTVPPLGFEQVRGGFVVRGQ